MKFNKAVFSKLAKTLAVPTHLLMASLLCLSLTSCRGGQVDEGCYWGPIPKNKIKMQELHDKGVKTIVVCRLNPMNKVAANAHELGMNFVHLPTGLFVNPTEENIQKLVTIARDPKMRPLYICDQVARDRTQFYAGIYGMVSQNWTADHASWQMYRNGLRHWWPWFYKFRGIVKNDEQEIHGDVPFKPLPLGQSAYVENTTVTTKKNLSDASSLSDGTTKVSEVTKTVTKTTSTSAE